MALHGFEQFNPGDRDIAGFGGGGIPNFGGGGMRPGDSDIAGFGQSFGPADPMAGLDMSQLLNPQAGEGFDWQKMLFGGKDVQGGETMGALTGGVNALSGIAQSILGYKQYGLAKKELGFQQEQARINNQNQMTTLNNLMRGQAENRRIATGGGQTGEQFVEQYGIKV